MIPKNIFLESLIFAFALFGFGWVIDWTLLPLIHFFLKVRPQAELEAKQDHLQTAEEARKNALATQKLIDKRRAEDAQKLITKAINKRIYDGQFSYILTPGYDENETVEDKKLKLEYIDSQEGKARLESLGYTVTMGEGKSTITWQ